MTHTFDIPVRRFSDEFVTVTVDDEMLMDCARHGLDQRINDTTAGIKRSAFTSDELFAAAVMKKVNGVVDRINGGTFNTRARGPVDPKKAATNAVARKIAAADPAVLAQIMALLSGETPAAETPETPAAE